MNLRLKAVFMDFATLGPGVDTAAIDRLVDVEYFDYSDAAIVPERLRGRQVAILNKSRIGADTIAAAAELELIALTATGTDNVACDEAKRRGVAVTNVRDYCSGSVAQHVLALTLGLIQHVSRYDDLVRRGEWSRSRSFALFDYPFRELAGRVLGLVGYGTLGRAVARLGECLDMRVLVSARPGDDGPAPAGRVPFSTVLEQADVLSLHCPLTEATHHLLGGAEFERMKPGAIVINTARGALIDQAALADALRSGRIGGAGIDVLPVEPPPADHVLLAPDIPNLLITPHVAWAAQEARQRALEQVAENIASFVAGGSLRRVV